MTSKTQRQTALTATRGLLPISAAVVAEGLSLLFMALVASAAGFFGLFYLLFPELGALAHDVLKHPKGSWGSQPWRLLITPVLTAVIGTLITRHLPYHFLTILLIVALSAFVILILRSAIAPAISAAVLPLVMGITSWWYPLSIAGDLVVLVALLAFWRKIKPVFWGREPLAKTRHLKAQKMSTWVPVFAFFVAVTGLLAQVTGLRFILFPPLIVIAYEMFKHPDVCPWALRPFSFPVACGLTALGGLAMRIAFGTGALAAGCSMGFSILVLRVFVIHMPPALAIGLLPLVIDSPSIKFPMSVVLGTTILTGLFLIWKRWTLNSTPSSAGRRAKRVSAYPSRKTVRNSS